MTAHQVKEVSTFGLPLSFSLTLQRKPISLLQHCGSLWEEGPFTIPDQMHKESVRQLQRAIFLQDNAVLTTFGTAVPWWPQNSGCYEFSPQIEDGVSHLM